MWTSHLRLKGLVGYALHRYVAVLLGWQAFTLCGQLGECTTYTEAGVAWLYHIVDIAILGCLVRIGE